MRNSHLSDLLKLIDIKKFIDENLTLSYITYKVLATFEENGWETKDVTSYIIKQFIKEELALIINPNKLDRNTKYWIEYKERTDKNEENEKPKINSLSPYERLAILFNPSPIKSSKTVNVITKEVTDMERSKTTNEPITLEDLNSNVDTVIKILNNLRSEIKTIKRTKGSSSSSESKEQNRAHVEDMINLLGSDYETNSVSINSNLLKNIQKLIREEYGIKNDINKAINIALYLAWHEHR